MYPYVELSNVFVRMILTYFSQSLQKMKQISECGYKEKWVLSKTLIFTISKYFLIKFLQKFIEVTSIFKILTVDWNWTAQQAIENLRIWEVTH